MRQNNNYTIYLIMTNTYLNEIRPDIAGFNFIGSVPSLLILKNSPGRMRYWFFLFLKYTHISL